MTSSLQHHNFQQFTYFHSRSSSIFLLFLIFSYVFSISQAANRVQTPILNSGYRVHVRPYAKLPFEDGKPAKILSITGHGGSLYICTITRIYRIHPKGFVELYLDVRQAIKAIAGRNLNLSNRVHGGLRSVAFHPRFWANGLFYTSVVEDRPVDPYNYYYLSQVPFPAAESVLVEWRHDWKTGKAIPWSYRCVFRVSMPVFDHPIKQIAFYGDHLYIAHGDGSVQSAVAGGGQGRDALGKILRINPLRAGLRPFTVPWDNVGKRRKDMIDEVFALGFRNPHNICFSRGGSLFVADAGRDNVEEINIVKNGGNYGWALREGTFVHNAEGGLFWGVTPLLENDAKWGLEYPVAMYGHNGKPGSGFIGTAVAGSCPVENGSPASGKYFYADFPATGALYWSWVKEMYQAVTKGTPQQLKQARTHRATILFDHDNNPATPPIWLQDLRSVIRHDPEYRKATRADVRFGRGVRGELYFSSKTDGRVYILTSSVPGSKI